jgi:DNA-directed RNA polymerase specialized sigma24 family protein
MRGDGSDDPDYFHPPQVLAALDRIRGASPADLLAACRIGDRGSAIYVPPGAIMRLIRERRQTEDDRTNTQLRSILFQRVLDLVRTGYRRLGRQGAQDVAQDVAVALLVDLAATDEIDFWEASFSIKLKRVAATCYRKRRQQYLPADHDEITEFQKESGDRGDAARQARDDALFGALAVKLLTAEEAKIALLLFREGIPLYSPRAEIDVARITGKAESTLRNIQTTIKAKLQAALAKEPSDGE